jgi:hypothetical protein
VRGGKVAFKTIGNRMMLATRINWSLDYATEIGDSFHFFSVIKNNEMQQNSSFVMITSQIIVVSFLLCCPANSNRTTAVLKSHGAMCHCQILMFLSSILAIPVRVRTCNNNDS